MIYPSHVISAFDDLSITLDFPSSNLTFPLVRGSPYLTFSVSNQTSIISLSTIHTILSFSSNQDHTKHTIKLNNDQTWLVYTSSPIHLTNHNLSVITSSGLSGIVRVAVLPDPESEAALDQFSSCYPFSGEAVFGDGFNLEYKWEAKGSGDLLMLAHPLHVNLLKNDDNVAFLEGVKYRNIDGELVGVVGDSWVLRLEPVSVTCHSINDVKEESKSKIMAALCKDVEGLSLTPVATEREFITFFVEENH